MGAIPKKGVGYRFIVAPAHKRKKRGEAMSQRKRTPGFPGPQKRKEGGGGDGFDRGFPKKKETPASAHDETPRGGR